ncbi:protein MCM10 homolog [Onthophagus taurus]|uniref:protein MCM10 homolog n=1 Tax=Onthophagus taurus TaxID=166361 RepID=UPI0039BE8F8F
MYENLESLLLIGSEFLEKEQVTPAPETQPTQPKELKEIDLFENSHKIELKENIDNEIINFKDLLEDEHEKSVITTTSFFKTSKPSLSSTWCKNNKVDSKPNLNNINATIKDNSHLVSFFGVRVSKPLVSSQLFSERMVNKVILTMAKLKTFLLGDVKAQDWVFGGVIVAKSPPKVNQKGSQYSIWTVSDLQFDLKTVSLFLFGNAHKELWKSCVGTVIAVLNPAVLEKRSNSKEEASLSISNPQHMMILGNSKDLGTCKSTKNDGSKCTAFVNNNHCEYCIYHVKKEYQKSSQRSELQSNFAGRGLTALRNKVLGKNQVFYAGKLYTSTQAKQSQKLLINDEKRLKQLSGEGSGLNQKVTEISQKRLAVTIDVSHKQRAKDLELLDKLSKSTPNKPESKDLLSCKPTLNNFNKVDLNVPISQRRKDIAKINAIKYVQKTGLLPKQNPMSTKGSGLKRPFQEDDETLDSSSKKPKNEFISDRYKKLMAATSKHMELLEQAENDLQEKYFKKLEAKEQMEEKMSQTYKMNCKAVRCLQCKYTNFSASDKCKADKHPLKVFDAVKRFFMCKNCKNRVVVLTFVPIANCKNCGSNKWEKSSVMKEKNVDKLHCLSIRGGEQTFLNSAITNDNLDLLVSNE